MEKVQEKVMWMISDVEQLISEVYLKKTEVLLF